MFFIFAPIGTDAPLYHYPITTVGLILANCVCFALTGAGNEHMTEPWILEFGSINPLEWLSSMFAHANFSHIIVNMIFLWTFGLIVEGKIGWLRMLGLYMFIGLTQAAFIQLIMLPFDTSGALGASSAIMGLMAICLIWAPKNDIKVFFFFWFWLYIRMKVIDVTVMIFAIFFLTMDLLSFVMSGLGMGTAALHLSGAAIGFGVGILMVKRNMVNCENWDIFNVMAGTYGREADKTIAVGSHADPTIMFGHSDVAVSDDMPDNSHQAKVSKRMKKIYGLIDDGDVMTASEKLMDLRMQDDTPLDEAYLRRLAIGLLKAEMPDEAEIYLEEFIEHYPEECAWARVRLAQLLLTLRKRPRAALKILKLVRLSQLNEEQQKLAKKLVMTGKKQIKAGVEDAEPEW